MVQSLAVLRSDEFAEILVAMLRLPNGAHPLKCVILRSYHIDQPFK